MGVQKDDDEHSQEVLEKGIPEAGKLILFKQPYPIFQHSPSAAFRGYRRIDGDMLLEQIKKRRQAGDTGNTILFRY